MTKLAIAAFCLSLGGFSAAAFAKGGSPQTHHCKMPDGTMDMAKTKAQCKAAKGSWAKDEAAPAAGADKAPAPAGADKAPAPTDAKK